MYLPAYTSLKYDTMFLANKTKVSVFYYFSYLFNFTTVRGAAGARRSESISECRSGVSGHTGPLGRH